VRERSTRSVAKQQIADAAHDICPLCAALVRHGRARVDRD
jgi:hypothetical protein